MKIYLVRHGEVLSNLLGQYYTTADDLTAVGIKQAEQLRGKIKNIHFDIVISFPYLRATHTEYILTDYDNSIVTDKRLRERGLGNLHGASKDMIDREKYLDYYSKTSFGISEDSHVFFKEYFHF